MAEAPDVHLLPHLQRACAEASSMFTLESSETDDQGAFVVRLRCRDQSGGLGQIRAAIYALIGQVAETASYIRQRRDPLAFEILTGIPPGEGPFASHGHVLLLHVV